MSIYAEIAQERHRANEKHGPQAMEALPITAFLRYTILAEEVGEVAKEFNEAAARGGQVDLQAMRGELIQVAAMAAAWAEQIGEEL
jgi:NTP pyrophosphatase (non-canonical NTP hydrolase)